MKFTSIITVPQTQQQVWQFLSNPLNANKWDRSIKEVILPAHGFTGKDCVVETVAPNGMHQSFMVTEFEPPRYFKFELLSSKMFKHAELSFLIEQVKTGTQITHDINIGLRGSAFFLYPILLLTQKKALARDMQYLREALNLI